ncbi:polyprenol monophosphomannose synthase [Cryobacterium lactosi]|jgi:dolichol-phosphate mannosyltransferase|uniref:Polyprenol monophosphomannose synthase n=1 Tax=Cryobacterium lactosi TaxID=1259202 RepID=A0A4R9BU38_9MICO|nr:polyprenol monophosphomannose synthase [Cryobacterium lactosi]TFD91028.1 polyprenol monophosphomannose synthase [Cryobacterium lactosi]
MPTTGNARAGFGSLVIIPTYNELQNLESIVARLLAATPGAHVLIVDDGSPDGTGELADRMAGSDDRIKVEHRTGKLGLGSAYVLGFGWGLERGYDYLIEMDADGSHPPERLPDMIAQVASDAPGAPSLAVGSRWVPGGSVVNWPRHRQLLSRGGNTYARLMLGLTLKDITAGFRVYSSATIAAMDLADVSSKGYCFQVDMTLRVLDQGRSVVELPIEFREREAGESKMSQAIVVEAMLRVTQWGFSRRVAKLRSGRSQATVG